MAGMSTAEQDAHSEASRIAHFIGLPRWRNIDDLALVDRVRKGFPASTVKTVVLRVDPHGRFLKPTDIIPRSTYHRRVKANVALSKDESERLLALSRVFAEALRIYRGDAKLVSLFLLREHPMLGGRQPIELAKESTAGADLVLKLLAKADAGIAA